MRTNLQGDVFVSYVFSALLLLLIAWFVFEMRHSMRRSSEAVRLISAYIDDLGNDRLIEEIYSYCCSDFKLRRIMDKHGAGIDDIRRLHNKLMLWGNFRKYNRFIPITSFFYAYSLDYLLEHRDGDAKELTQKMMNFFNI